MSRSAHRFVILHHTGFGPEHWDFMVEDGGHLATWKLYHEPRSPGKEGWELLRLGDHRTAYLTYEGPVSGGRGVVRRVVSGRCEIVERGPRCWRIRLRADRLSGEFVLRRDNPPHWRMLPAEPWSPDG